MIKKVELGGAKQIFTLTRKQLVKVGLILTIWHIIQINLLQCIIFDDKSCINL